MTTRSHQTQILQNYFDDTDRRSRENPVSLESQLLNIPANELENLELRIDRETNLALQTVATNIDNGGVYYGGRVPEQFLTGPDQEEFDSVVAKKDATTFTLTRYDDTLPIPSRIILDTDNAVFLDEPIMFNVTGSGDSLTQQYTVQHVFPGDFVIPNKLTLWVDQTGLNDVVLNLTITGETAPQPAWFAERKKTTEVLTVRGEGVAYTRNRWATIDHIIIRGLPVGVRLRGWCIGFNLPATPDAARPYTTPQDRDTLFPRYWQISNSETLLKESYRPNSLSGFEWFNSYLITDTLTDAAVEPNTNGMYLSSGTKIYYIDRREILPDLTNTGISTEPLYGLQVVPDITKTGPVRYVVLSGIPYASAQSIFQYRYIVTTLGSVNNTFSILPNGALGPANAGWRGGAPVTVSFPMLTTGDYVFQLEMQDVAGQTIVDVVPFHNAAWNPLRTIDLSTSFDNIAGMAFDSYGVLWIWNGQHAIPLDIHYDGYVFDADSKTIFSTEPVDSIQIS